MQLMICGRNLLLLENHNMSSQFNRMEREKNGVQTKVVKIKAHFAYGTKLYRSMERMHSVLSIRLARKWREKIEKYCRFWLKLGDCCMRGECCMHESSQCRKIARTNGVSA